MALLLDESFTFGPVSTGIVKSSGVVLHYGAMFTPGSNITVSGIETYIGAEVGASPQYRFGIKQYLRNTSAYLCSGGQTNTSAGWKTIYTSPVAGVTLTSGVPYYIYIQPSGAASTTAYIGINTLDRTAFTTGVPNLTDFTTTIDVSTDVYLSTDSGVSWTAQSLHPLFKLIEKTTGSCYGQPYDVINPLAEVGSTLAWGQVTVLGSTTFVSGIGFLLKKSTATAPADDMWFELLASNNTSMGSWFLAGSAAATTSLQWFDVYGIDTTLTKGTTYRFYTKSPLTLNPNYWEVGTLQATASGSIVGFKGTAGCLETIDNAGGSTLYKDYDMNFRIYGSPYAVSAIAWSQFLNEAMAMADTKWNAGSYWKTETLTFADTNFKAYSGWKTDTLAIADTQWKASSIWKPETLTIADTKWFSGSYFKTDNLTIGDTRAMGMSLEPKTETLTMADSEFKAYIITIVRNLMETLRLIDSIAKGAGITKDETVTVSDSQFKETGKRIADNLALAENMAKSMTKPFTETLTLQDISAKLASISKSETLSVSESDSILIQRMLNLVENLQIAESLIAAKTSNITLTDNLSLSDAFKRIVNLGNLLVNEFTDIVTDDISDHFQRNISD